MNITKEYLHELFDYKDGVLYWKKQLSYRGKIGMIAGSFCKRHIYSFTRIHGRLYRTHRIIFMMHHGYMPEMVDHIDIDRTNNRIENLRAATDSQNKTNSRSRVGSASKYKGVYLNKKSKKNPWVSKIYMNKTYKSLGSFKTEDEAASAYNSAAKEMHGEFACLNIIIKKAPTT